MSDKAQDLKAEIYRVSVERCREMESPDYPWFPTLSKTDWLVTLMLFIVFIILMYVGVLF